MPNLSRRHLVTSAAALPALAVAAAIPVVATVSSVPMPPAAIAAISIAPDPIFAAIAENRRLYAAWGRANKLLDAAEGEIKERCPCTLVAWRHYSHIGHSEIEDARDEFLALPDANPEIVEREYREVKAAERTARRAERQWYKRNGLADLKANHERTMEAENKARWALTRIKPTTAAGAGALVAHVLDDMKIGEHPWQLSALANAAAALKSMGNVREAV